MSIKRYRKKPVEISAAKWDGTAEQATPLIEWMLQNGETANYYCEPPCSEKEEGHVIRIYTLEGAMDAQPGDYIICGVANEFYPCKPDIFAATYESATDNEAEADEHHSVQELYDYRMAYNSLLFNQWARDEKYDVHKSWRHGDGEKCFGGGWFIVSATTPYGQVTNHYSSEHWHRFHVPTRERAAEWDGHTPQQALERLIRLTEVISE